ncbi:hypothetical protein HPB47_010394, partial [Ixodes persulcatus]
FFRQQSVTLRQNKTGTLLTPYLLQRFHHNSSSGSRSSSNIRGTTAPTSGTCGLCHIRANMENLLWESLKNSEPRTKAIGRLDRAIKPTSLHFTYWPIRDPPPP